MTAIETRNWHSRNQAALAEALAGLKARLRRHAESGRSEVPGANGPMEDLPPPVTSDGRPSGGRCSGLDPGPPSALEDLCAAFGLSSFERDVLVLCAGVELDSAVAPLCAAAHGDPSRPFPTFSLALAALPDAHWSALSPEAPLRRWRLIEVGAGPTLTLAQLRIDERVLHHVVGLRYPDDRLGAMIEPVGRVAAGDLSPSHAAVAEQVAAAWLADRGRHGPMPIIQLYGPDPADRRAVAAAAAGAVGRRAAAIPADVIPSAVAEMDALARLWEREAALDGMVLLVECDEADPAADPSRARRAGRLIERVAGLVMMSDRERRPVAHRPVVSFDVPRPTPTEQRAAWHAALGQRADEDPSGIDALAAQFSLGLPAIRSAAVETVARCAATPGSSVARTAWDVSRALCRTHLDDLAQRIEPSAGWDDLVLPDPQIEAIRRVAQHVRHRATVYDDWGFAARSSRGLGTSALFAGSSGTGKTMAAEVLANELRLDLYRIDLAGVVSKYIGETEKNLRRVFEAAEHGGAILLFDEADALFGKRSEVRDSHDRYANIEVSYLLQRMEAYRGLAILTTNLKSAMDPAFLRRIRFVVQFPFPDVPQRAEIWRRIFPASTPTAGLDAAKLAKLNVPGGNIRNIAMNAAFLAAEAGEPVRMRHVGEAARIEYAKLERSLGDAEIGGW
jgi:ATPase family associated with various cellular activities (AAA)